MRERENINVKECVRVFGAHWRDSAFSGFRLFTANEATGEGVSSAAVLRYVRLVPLYASYPAAKTTAALYFKKKKM